MSTILTKIDGNVYCSVESNKYFNYQILEKDGAINYNLKSVNELFLPFLDSSQIKDDTGILPPGVLFINKNIVVFERPPEYKNLFVIPKTVTDIQKVENEEQRVYRIPLPWQLYIVHFNSVEIDGQCNLYPSNVKMHFTKGSVTSSTDEVFMAPIPNFYSSGNLCRPMFANMDDIERYPKNVAGVIEAAYDWVWNCGTNLDLTECLAQLFHQSHYTENTLAHKIYGDSIPKIQKSFYYVGFHHVDEILGGWENCTIEEVCQFNWPLNNIESQFSYDNSRSQNDFLLDFLRSKDIEPIFEPYHYDEDNDEYYNCHPDDEFCDCMIPQNSYDVYEFHAWLKKRIPSGTIQQSIKSFRKSVDPTAMLDEVVDVSPIRASRHYQNVVDLILYAG